MSSLKLQRANYQLAVTLNHHARTASATGAAPATTDARGRDAQLNCTSKVSDNFRHLPSNPIAQVWVDCELKADVELCRIAIGLRQSAQMRLWLIGHEHTRATGYNYLDRNQFAALLDHYGIKYTRHNLNRWLRAGQGVYWRFTDYGRIYLCSYERLSQSLVQECLNGFNTDITNLVATNLPGMLNAMYVRVDSDNLEQFEAQVYAAWHAAKECQPLSRYTLQRLWNRDTKTLIRWQKAGRIQLRVLHNFVHYTEDFSHHVPQAPEGGYRGGVIQYKAGKSRRWSAEYSNSYQPRAAIRQHPRRGAYTRVMRRSMHTVESYEPATSLRGGETVKTRRPGGLIRTGKYLYQDGKKAKNSAKYDNPEQGNRERAIQRGIDDRLCQHFEHSPDGVQRMRASSCNSAYKAIVPKTQECVYPVYSDPF